jgi:starvation-inducible DNA-binding protein
MKPNIGLPDKARNTVIKVLQPLLADEVALYIATRGAHWNVTGPNFHAMHKFFEAQYEALDETLDDVAERIRSLGGEPDSNVAAYAKAKRIKDNAGDAKSAKAMIESLLEAHEAIIQQLRKDEEITDDVGDEGTTDFLTGLMEEHEKMAWMLRAHLE